MGHAQVSWRHDMTDQNGALPITAGEASRITNISINLFSLTY